MNTVSSRTGNRTSLKMSASQPTGPTARARAPPSYGWGSARDFNPRVPLTVMNATPLPAEGNFVPDL